MATVEGPDPHPKCDHHAERATDAEESLLSPRSLSIIIAAAAIGMIVGIGSGAAAGLAVVTTAGAAWAVALGLITGIDSALLAGLAAAGGLYVLINRKTRK
ncbi:hypothetical protein ACOZ38_14040 [Sphaerisporangium viridialbum]|uniref:hypothetical protein n=1 Tax=Sphaerisporangium viridialbum TaxID=46189 RepID=UPI003C74C395